MEMGYNYNTTKINPDVMCSVIDGIDDVGKRHYQNYQVMVGALYQENLKTYDERKRIYGE
jgi:hypothetical protein